MGFRVPDNIENILRYFHVELSIYVLIMASSSLPEEMQVYHGTVRVMNWHRKYKHSSSAKPRHMDCLRRDPRWPTAEGW